MSMLILKMSYNEFAIVNVTEYLAINQGINF